MLRTSPATRAILAVAMLTGAASAVCAAGSARWSLLSTGGDASTSVSGHTAVYDPATNAMIVFGGFDYRLGPAQTNAVLLLSHANGLGGASDWSTLVSNGAAGSPSARDLHAAAYDSASNRMIVFGGFDPVAGLRNDTWVLANANGTGGAPLWIQLAPTGSAPAARFGHVAALDAANDRLLVFGGDNQAQTFADVWVLSHADGLGGTPSWTQLAPTGAPPTGGSLSSAVYDAASNVMIVFGGGSLGSGSPTVTNGVWTLSSANGLGGTPHWTNIVPNGAHGSPVARWSHSAIYDAATNRMTIFGGESQGKPTFPLPDLADLWVLDGANGLAGTPTWSQLKATATGNPPSRRDSFAAVYDPGSNRMILFGGEDYDAVYFRPWVLTGANGL